MAKRKAENTTAVCETDLYRPVHDYLAAQGFTVRGEVKHCDIAAVRGDEIVVVELKRSLSLALLGQAVQRQHVTDSVYVAIPRPRNKNKWIGQSKGVIALLKRLEIGLLLVSSARNKTPVDVVLHPLPCEKPARKRGQKAVLKEIERRSADFNEGGCCRTKLMTAYRENAVHIACCLLELGPVAPRSLRKLGTGEKTLSILRSNFYGWFERVSHGVYALSSKGRVELQSYPELVEHYRRLLEQQSGIDEPVAAGG